MIGNIWYEHIFHFFAAPKKNKKGKKIKLKLSQSYSDSWIQPISEYTLKKTNKIRKIITVFRMEDLRFSDGFCTTSFGNNPEVDGEVSEAAEAC